MPQYIDKNEVLKRIDGVLDYVNESIKNMNQEIERDPYNATLKNNLISKGVSLVLKMKQTLEDIAPRKSEYWVYAKSIKIIYSRNMIDQLSEVLKSLKHDYSNNFLNSFNEMIDADIFTDILEQAEYLLSQSYFRASAVVAGVALESHLRKLAEKNQIPITSDDGKYVKADSLNGYLLKSQIIDKTMNKSITSWLGLRNDAAHPDAKQGDEGMIKLMIYGIKLFIEKYPA